MKPCFYSKPEIFKLQALRALHFHARFGLANEIQALGFKLQAFSSFCKIETFEQRQHFYWCKADTFYNAFQNNFGKQNPNIESQGYC